MKSSTKGGVPMRSLAVLLLLSLVFGLYKAVRAILRHHEEMRKHGRRRCG